MNHWRNQLRKILQIRGRDHDEDRFIDRAVDVQEIRPVGVVAHTRVLGNAKASLSCLTILRHETASADQFSASSRAMDGIVNKTEYPTSVRALARGKKTAQTAVSATVDGVHCFAATKVR